eukprot:GHVN01032930.1.p1 GENE.GHVN01032930.1~~GHVN01032930.1.p1  ORF type:complete len:415 (-),score=154.67 GHVN01032930.1:97-1341(-)
MGRGVIGDDHCLCVSAMRSKAIGEADLVVVLGARLNWMLHWGQEPKWSKDAKFIIVDIKKEECEGDKVTIGINCDLSEVLDRWMLSELVSEVVSDVGERQHKGRRWRGWVNDLSQGALKRLNAGRERRRDLGATVIPVQIGEVPVCVETQKGGLKYKDVMSLIANCLEELTNRGEGVTLVCEGANTLDFSRREIQVSEVRGRLDTASWGTMGVGLAAAIAQGMADKRRMSEGHSPQSPHSPHSPRLTLALEGDSAIGFSLSEIETIVRWGLPVLVVVFNNGGVYGRHGSLGDAPGTPLTSQPCSLLPMRYDLVMRAAGGRGWHVSNLGEVKAALNEALRCGPHSPTSLTSLMSPISLTTPTSLTSLTSLTSHTSLTSLTLPTSPTSPTTTPTPFAISITSVKGYYVSDLVKSVE